MSREQLPDRLSKITTMWTVLRAAQAEGGVDAAAAQQMLAQRYGGAVYRYLKAILRDAAAADDLAQEFALGLVRGAYRGADPGRGRFRDYIKGVLFHLVSGYRRQERKGPPIISLDKMEQAPSAAEETAFVETWREDLLQRVWNALAAVHPELHAVLRLRVAHPELTSAELARKLGKELNKKVSAAAARQSLRRARAMFAELLVEEVAGSLEKPSIEEVQAELAELNLLEYVQPVLERRAEGA